MSEPGQARLIVAGSQKEPGWLAQKPLYQKCRNPIPLHGTRVSCGRCEPCLARVRHDAVGRGVAESYGCDDVLMVTYTIGGDRFYGSVSDNPKAQGLCKDDLQAALKRLLTHTAAEADKRNLARPELRNFAVGEFGDQKGRPHYHQLLYERGIDGFIDLPEAMFDQPVFYGKMDPSVDVRNFPHIKSERTLWPFGYIHVKRFERRDVAYLANYVNKPPSDDQAGGLRLMRPIRSTKPLLGAAWFDHWARDIARGGLPLHDDGYRLPRDPGYHGRGQVYWMNKAVKRLVVAAYKDEWRNIYGNEAWPFGSLIEQMERGQAQRDDLACEKVEFEGREFQRRMAQQRADEEAKLLRLKVEGAARRWPDGNAYEAFRSGSVEWREGDFELLHAAAKNRV